MTRAARNIELKARLSDLVAAEKIARALATKPREEQHQTDTYFGAQHGRLKLREIVGREAQLVWYSRADTATAKSSDYRLVPVGDSSTLKQALAAALGVVQIVEKRRLIYFYENVRIHLDEVVGLGSFLEFEAVLGPNVDDAAGRAQVDFLQSAFQLEPADLIERSYSDLLPKRDG